MICKDCRPVFYTAEELRREKGTVSTEDYGSYGLVLKHVELCSRCEALHKRADIVGDMVAKLEEEAQERRRYALLRAAAVLAAGHLYGEPHDAEIANHVVIAERLLAEIERRERKEPQP